MPPIHTDVTHDIATHHNFLNDNAMEINPIATFRSPFPSKFGIPKQSSLVKQIEGRIVFNAPYRNPDFIRGIEDFDFLWIIWEFSANSHIPVSPLVRPPLLGGNTKKGVFATRSPFRPNGLGLSSVRLLRVETDPDGAPTLVVSGADIMDGTPIYDIKPYIEYADAHTGVRSGFTDSHPMRRLEVYIPQHLRNQLTTQDADAITEILALDPRPHYHDDAEKTYGLRFKDFDIHFKVDSHRCTVINLGNDT